MDFAAFEHDRKFVIEALRRGELDYLEPVTEAAEADFFRHLFSRDILTKLAEKYPTPRKKEEVPVWLYLASQITLKLHDASYHAFPYVLRSGGLISALGPTVGRKVVHPDTKDVTLACEGFNKKNTNGRQTPGARVISALCDQDFVRKFAKDTKTDRLHAWFNREVPRTMRAMRLYDEEGLFIGDGSYVFVPDNENYEGSVKLLFDEHNHPVDSKKVDLRDKRYQWRRCYKVVSLIHVNRSLDLFLTVAARNALSTLAPVVPGNKHECPILYEMVDDFVKAVGRGWMKILMVDRGLIDGPNMGRLKTDYHIDTVVPLKKNMGAYQDAIGLTRLKDFKWEPYALPYATERDQKDRPKHPTIVKREETRQKTLAKKKGLPPPQPVRQPQTLLGIARGVNSWADCPVPLTVVINREVGKDGNVDDWVLTTTSATMSATRTRENYGLRTSIEERHRQYKCFWDLARMTSPKFSLVVSHVLFALLAYTLLQAHLFLRQRKEMNSRTRGRILDILNPAVQVVAVYYQQRFCLLTLGEFGMILLELDEEARVKLRPKMKQIHWRKS